MDKNIQASLIRYNGDIGPTILDVEDKTDGPDGTTKPLTKEMLQQMIVANFPELQKVRDADVKTELESVKAELQSLKEHTFNTQLSGSNVENIIPRGVLDSNNIINTFRSPFGVKGVIFELKIFGVTGTFDSGQGISLRAFGRSSDGNSSIYSIAETEKTSNRTSHHFAIIHPSFKLENYDSVGGSQFTGASVVPMPVHRADVRVDGSFSDGEGFDCELNAVFIY